MKMHQCKWGMCVFLYSFSEHLRNNTSMPMIQCVCRVEESNECGTSDVHDGWSVFLECMGPMN